MEEAPKRVEDLDRRKVENLILLKRSFSVFLRKHQINLRWSRQKYLREIQIRTKWPKKRLRFLKFPQK